MPLELGAAFAPRQIVVVEEFEPAPPTVEDLRTEQLLTALAGLQEALNNMQAPVVNVAEPDLTAIVQAVTQLNGPASAQEIAQAIKAELAPTEQPKTDQVLEDLTAALKQLDFRMKGFNGGGGGGGVGSRVQNEPNTSLDTQPAALDTRYEWQAQGSQSVPLYVGTAPPGTATSSPLWRVDRYTYDIGPAGDNVPTVVQSATGAWDSRASLF